MEMSLDSPKIALRTDALTELILGGVLIVAGLGPVGLGDAFAVWGWLAWLVAIGLPAISVALWISRPNRETLASVSLVNLACAAIFLAWWGLHGSGVTTFGAIMLAVSSLGLVLLGAWELLIVRGARRSPASLART